MLKLYDRGKNFIIRNSMFDIRYSFREHGKFIIPELPTTEELAKHLHIEGSASEILHGPQKRNYPELRC